MKLKKLIAAASALTLLGSLAVAVPASAATGSTTVTASVAAQVRSQNEEWSLMHANGTKFVPDSNSNNNNNIETSGKAHNDEDGDYQVYFAAFYYFDASELLPEGATITSATIDMYQGDWCYVKITDTLNLCFLVKSAKCTNWSHLFHGLLDNEPLMA